MSTTRQAAYVFDFNDRELREGAIVQRVRDDPMTAPQGHVADLDLVGNRVYVLFAEDSPLNGWYDGRKVC